MITLRFTEQQFQSLQNLLGPQPVAFDEVERVSFLSRALKSPRINPNNSIEVDLNSEDLELLHALLQEGTIRIKEIPAALDLLRALTPATQGEDGPLYEQEQDDTRTATVHRLENRVRE
jgi:hypothetical protein